MRSELVNAALRVAWQQWTALGVAGTVAPPDHAIDLEALILFTPVLRHDDPRLHDEAFDWCVHHAHRLVSIGRLRRLRAALPDQARDAYDNFAACVNATSAPRMMWPTNHAGDKTRTSGKSQPPNLRHPALLQLRLRCLFGVTARADVLLQFLRPRMVHELSPSMTLTVSAFADLGYSKPAIAEVLNDLAMAELLERWRRGNRDYYELALVDALRGLISGPLPATAPSWVSRFRILASLLSAEATTHEKKPVVQAVAILRQLEQHHDALERLGVKPPAHAQTWPDLASWARRALLDEPAPEQMSRAGAIT